MSGEFCDTNILVYAYDCSAGTKHLAARSLVSRLWQSTDGVVSIQVLQELYVNLVRQPRPAVPTGDARSIVRNLGRWRLFVPKAHDVLTAIDGSIRWQVSFWDAMVLIAAASSSANVLWTEDLNDGQRYDDVLVRNPFLAGS
jgi:predicted nucleic acid-binding protein